MEGILAFRDVVSLPLTRSLSLFLSLSPPLSHQEALEDSRPRIARTASDIDVNARCTNNNVDRLRKLIDRRRGGSLRHVTNGLMNFGGKPVFLSPARKRRDELLKINDTCEYDSQTFTWYGSLRR